MNDRLYEIINQCFIGTRDGKLSESNTVENVEEFAKLLVLECVNAVMDGTREGDHYAQRIEQHFDNGPGGILRYGDKESTVDQQLRNRSTYFGNNP